MALTIALVKVWHNGDRKDVIVDVTFDTSYPADGEPLTGADLSLGVELNYVSDGFATKSDNSLGVLTRYDYTNKKLIAFKSNTASNMQPVADTASLDTYVARLRCVGKGSAAA